MKLAVDGNRNGTAWTTESYSGGLEGVGKSGVGISVDAGEPVEAVELNVVTLTPGWSGEVYATAEDPHPDDLQGWGEPVGTMDNVDEDSTTDLTLTEPAQHYLIWITDLGDNDAVEISDIRLLG